MSYRDREDRGGNPGEQYRGYEVRDRDGDKIGKVEDLFVDSDDRPEYIGVKMGLLGSKTTLIPMGLVRTDEEQRVMEVDQSKDRVKDAPSFGQNEEITSEREEEIYTHFGLSREDSSQNPAEDSSSGSREQEASPGYREETSSSGSQEARGGEQPDTESTGARREPWSGTGGEEGREAGARVRRSPGDRGGQEAGAESRSTESPGAGSETYRDTSDRDTGDRETVRVPVKRERATAERVRGEDGREEVRIRKEMVEEEEIVEVEDRLDADRPGDERGRSR
ncbi:MAG: PRC-barrel domain-containing protein [Rubrobacter sp.]|nr:PRC-barrel domain-containing protein [Rubrobacter sp.]